MSEEVFSPPGQVMKKRLGSCRIVAAFFFAIAALAPRVGARQAPAEAPPAPVPAQLAGAKRIFISNAGVDGYTSDPYSGSPQRTYNEFYAALKAWGQLEMVPTPAEADVVVEILQANLPNGTAAPIPQLRARMVDPKTHVTLWVVTIDVPPANRLTTAKKNYSAAMTELVNQVKMLFLPPPPPAAKK